MTDPLRLSDEELAAVSLTHRGRHWCTTGNEYGDPVERQFGGRRDDDPCEVSRLLADRRALAEQAAIGAAVERLQRYRASWTLDWHPNAWRVVIRGGDEEEAYVSARLTDAVAAALDPEPRHSEGPVFYRRTCPVCHKSVAVQDGEAVLHDPSHEPRHSEGDRLVTAACHWPCMEHDEHIVIPVEAVRA